MTTLVAGLTGAVTTTVTAADTARALGSGDVDVLGTPRLVALLEEAAVAAVAGRLDEGQTSVGTHIEIEHLRASPVATVVWAEARLVAVDGRRLTFEVTARDANGEVGRGSHRRAIIARERLLRPPS